MKKKNKRKIMIFSLVILVIIFLIIGFQKNKLSLFPLSIVSTGTFVGFNWNAETLVGGVAQCSGDAIVNEKGFLVLNAKLGSAGNSGSGNSCQMRVTLGDISSIDELLIIFDSTSSAGTNSGSTAFITINQESIFGEGVNSNQNQYFEPKVLKIRNNFDGTYSVLKSLNIGDIFIEIKKISTVKPAYLTFSAYIGSSPSSGGGTASMTIYNIVRKENAFAVCKADEYLTTDLTGKVICKPLSTIVLNSEEAIKESFDAKLARITAELEAKNIGLTDDITALKQQLAQQQSIPQQDNTLLISRISLLEAELKETKLTLANVQEKDKNVIAVVEAQEQFKQFNTSQTFIQKNIYIPIKEIVRVDKETIRVEKIPLLVWILLGLLVMIILYLLIFRNLRRKK